jgi:hypothetical protein
MYFLCQLGYARDAVVLEVGGRALRLRWRDQPFFHR